MGQCRRRIGTRAVLTVAAGLLLAACQTTIASLSSPLATVLPEPPFYGTAAPDQELPLVELIAVNNDPEQVVGLIPGELTSLLGTPGFVRRDIAAEVWQYRENKCVLDLFLYRDATANGPHVVHYEVRPRQPDAALTQAAQRSCFGQLLRNASTV